MRRDLKALRITAVELTEKSVMAEETASAKALRSEILVMFKGTRSPVWGQVGREKEIREDQVEKDFSFFCE